MIVGIGVDIAKISRFQSLASASQERLLRVFSQQELADCMMPDHAYDLAKLAARFAAKEAFFKALSASLIRLKLTQQTSSLLAICKLVEVISPLWGVPTLHVDWLAIETIVEAKLANLNVNISLSHEKDQAVAFVVIELPQ